MHGPKQHCLITVLCAVLLGLNISLLSVHLPHLPAIIFHHVNFSFLVFVSVNSIDIFYWDGIKFFIELRTALCC